MVIAVVAVVVVVVLCFYRGCSNSSSRICSNISNSSCRSSNRCEKENSSCCCSINSCRRVVTDWICLTRTTARLAPATFFAMPRFLLCISFALSNLPASWSATTVWTKAPCSRSDKAFSSWNLHCFYPRGILNRYIMFGSLLLAFFSIVNNWPST